MNFDCPDCSAMKRLKRAFPEKFCQVDDAQRVSQIRFIRPKFQHGLPRRMRKQSRLDSPTILFPCRRVAWKLCRQKTLYLPKLLLRHIIRRAAQKILCRAAHRETGSFADKRPSGYSGLSVRYCMQWGGAVVRSRS